MKQPFSTTSTKQGVASLYVVIFATILFGVITLSFVRIILSERIQGSNDDLSRSAYDSALAGVEDAKRAVADCIADNGGVIGACDTVLYGGDCTDFKLKEYLYTDLEESEVKIQESASNQSEQAYTCVILSNKVADYRSTLTSDTRTRIVPIGIGADLSRIKHIQFNWYSDVNNGTTDFRYSSGASLPDASHKTVPPTVALTLIKAGATINPADFNNSTSDYQSNLLLLPSNEDTARNAITSGEVHDAANSDVRNVPFLIKCERSVDFACKVSLDVDFTDVHNAMLAVSLPYGDTATDFAVALTDAEGNTIDFENVQISVDSTGRANQLVRRVEARLDPADAFFPYPAFAAELDGSPDDMGILKNLWYTANCWSYRYDGAEHNGVCDNNSGNNVEIPSVEESPDVEE